MFVIESMLRGPYGERSTKTSADCIASVRMRASRKAHSASDSSPKTFGCGMGARAGFLGLTTASPGSIHLNAASACGHEDVGKGN